MKRGEAKLSNKSYFCSSSPPECRSQAVVCISTPMMCPRISYFLVSTISKENLLTDKFLIDSDLFYVMVIRRNSFGSGISFWIEKNVLCTVYLETVALYFQAKTCAVCIHFLMQFMIPKFHKPL